MKLAHTPILRFWTRQAWWHFLPVLLDMARFRNLIVHGYARIDDALVYGILQKQLNDFDAFARAVQACLEFS